MDKQKFIDQYNLEHAVEQNSLKTFTSHFTLRNVLAGILLSIGIIVFVIYILVFSAYNEYGSVYTSMQDVFNSMGVSSSERNYIYSQMGQYYHVDWVRVYKEMSNYLVIISMSSLTLATLLWGIAPNFTFMSIINHLRRKDNIQK